MSNLYAYGNELWKQIQTFSYTGTYQSFTLDPGRYLIICYGGRAARDTSVQSSCDSFGGMSMGVLDLNEQKTMYAVVGGDGVAPTTASPTQGGFNGGANGGGRYNNSSSYKYGGSGAGGTDVRLKAPSDFPASLNKTHGLPNDYQEMVYLNATGGKFATSYVPNANTAIEMTLSTTDNTHEMMPFGQYYNDTTKQFTFILSRYAYPQTSSTGRSACFLYGTMSITDPPVVDPDVDLSLPNVYRCSREGLRVNGELIQEIIDPVDTLDTRSLTFLQPRRQTSYQSSKIFYGEVYEIKIYENDGTDDTLLYHYIPAYRKYDNAVGFYDLVNNTFAAIDGSATKGPLLFDEREDKSFLTRFIVAGGGGGASGIAPSQGVRSYAGVGGGWYGGPIDCNASAASRGAYAHMTNGYSFGRGEVPTRKPSSGSYNTQGAGGGGGGWYGGYAIAENGTNTSGNGGGGSGFVLTEDTVEDVPTGYDVSSDFYMEQPFTCVGMADTAGVIICEATEEINEGDVITAFTTGQAEHISFPPGKYRLKCWGGHGGVSGHFDNLAHGGYAEGLLTLRGPETLHLYVGGCGMMDVFWEPNVVRQRVYPPYAFNGGGVPPRSANWTSGYLHAGGGGTDIRVGFDSLYARVIVAGGGGGGGGYGGGAGGGTTGGTYASTSNGVNSGPGTQTESPMSATYRMINGGFGFGGACNYSESGSNLYRGTCGGGGWYGGSGTYNTSTSYPTSGCGGSGYVFTESSYKPANFLLDDQFYLENTVLTQGGNNLTGFQAKIEIEVVDTKVFRMLCRDRYGVKYFDQETDRWTQVIPETETPTVALFEQYGAMGIMTDDGLEDEYEILVYDPSEVANKAVLNVTPNKQTIINRTRTQMYISDIKRDLDCDPLVFNCQITTKRIPNGLNTYIETTIEIEKSDLTNTEAEFRMYYIVYSSE